MRSGELAMRLAPSANSNGLKRDAHFRGVDQRPHAARFATAADGKVTTAASMLELSSA